MQLTFDTRLEQLQTLVRASSAMQFGTLFQPLTPYRGAFPALPAPLPNQGLHLILLYFALFHIFSKLFSTNVRFWAINIELGDVLILIFLFTTVLVIRRKPWDIDHTVLPQRKRRLPQTIREELEVNVDDLL